MIVAQSQDSLLIWYSSEDPDKKTVLPIKGKITGVQTKNGVSLSVEENHVERQVQLDDLLIKFGFALEGKDLPKCVRILEERKEQDSFGHWKNLLQISLEEQNYFVAERCFAAIGDTSKASYFR